MSVMMHNSLDFLFFKYDQGYFIETYPVNIKNKIRLTRVSEDSKFTTYRTCLAVCKFCERKVFVLFTAISTAFKAMLCAPSRH